MTRRAIACGAIALCAVAVILTAAPLAAQIPRKMNYQIMLTDNDNQPLVEQPIQLVFRLYDVGSGGGALWTETHDDTTNAIGVVSLVLGSIAPIDLAVPDALWLEVEVDGEVMSPRSELASAPYALRAAVADDADSLGGVAASEYAELAALGEPGAVNDAGNPVDWTKLKGVPAGIADGDDATGGTGDGHSLDASDGSPADALQLDEDGYVSVAERVTIGSDTLAGYLIIEHPDIALTAARLDGGNGDGGRLLLAEVDGQNAVQLYASTPATEGGYLRLGTTSQAGVSLFGDREARGGGAVRLDGEFRDIRLDTTWEGDQSVRFPDDAVSSPEILDEPGVASTYDTTHVSVPADTTVQAICSRMIAAPGAGYVLAVGTVELHFIDGIAWRARSAEIGISLSPGAFSHPDLVFEVLIESDDGHDTRVTDLPVTVQGLFPVTAGQHEFHLCVNVADAGHRNLEARARILTLVYLPTAYGDVDEP